MQDQTTTSSEADRDPRWWLARSMWQATNGDQMPDSAEARKEAWSEAKPEMMRLAAKIIKRLEKNGVSVSQAS